MPFLSDSVAFPPSLYTVPCCLFLSCAFCPFASTTCCGSICWTVGRKRLHFTEALQVMSGPSNRRFPLELQSWEQWERGSTWLGALMEKVEMPSPCHCQEEQNIEQSAGVHLGSLGWGSGCERLVDGPPPVLHWPRTGLFPRPLRCTTAEALGHRIYPILKFNTHAFCRKEG